MRYAIVCSAVMLAGCATRPVTIREPIEVIRYVYVPIDASLTAACPIAMPRNDGGSELLRVARERRKALEQCNADKRAIRGVQGTPVP